VRTWLPWTLLIAASLLAAACHRWARARRASKDCGDYWARVIRWFCAGLFPLLCLSAMIETLFPAFFPSGFHLHFDRVVGSWWTFPAAAALPFVVWSVMLLLAMEPKLGDRGAWLAGSIGYTTSRMWVLVYLPLLLLPVLWLGRERLNLGLAGYSAATWGAAAVLAISLVGIAFSEGEAATDAETETAPAAQTAVASLRPWPESLAAIGIRTDQVFSWEATAPPRSVKQESRDFAERLILLGGMTIAPQVVEAVHQLVSARDEAAHAPQQGGQPAKARSCLLLAPDDCGQLEAMALAASELALRLNESTLLITPRFDPALATRLQQWVPASRPSGAEKVPIVPIAAGAVIPRRAGIWLVDAATLSDDFMIRLTDRAIVSRLGLVVWWDVHAYTGVLAANAWAISRRLYRLLKRGRDDVRTLALVRYAAHSDAQMARFVRRLLPYDFPPQSEIHVERAFPRSVHLHMLAGHQAYFERPESRSLPPRCRHAALVATLESARLEWPTAFEAAAEIAADEAKEVLDLPVGQTQVKDLLVSSPASAGARIRWVSSSEVLSVEQIIAHGGRSGRPDIPHHCAIFTDENPYAQYVLRRLKTTSTMEASRRLVGAAGQPAIARRHLLLALNEMEDTRSGLFHALAWEEDVIQQTLDDIAKENKLASREVRYLDRLTAERRIEHVYRSSMSRHNERRPLDTAGERVVIVRDTRAALDEDGVRMRVDAERLLIQAYPGRVFFSRGQRYRVGQWERVQDWIGCEREENAVCTWRGRNSSVSRMAKAGAELVTGLEGQLLKQLPVTLRYEEEVNYLLRLDHDLTRGGGTVKRIRTPTLRTSFDTRALILHFEPRPQDSEVRTLCLALRHVIPVHLGVEADALEVVAIDGQFVDRTRVYGLAIVDLYPQGIGLVEAIEEDHQLLLRLFEWTREWLTEAAAAMQHGQPNPLSSPLADATGGEQNPQSALPLLRRVVGIGRLPGKASTVPSSAQKLGAQRT
jgi:hypothetical protein